MDIVGVIVLGLNLVKQEKDCPAFGFFGSFDSKGNRAIIANNFIRASMKILALSDEGLFDLKVKFFKTKIDERIIDKEKEKYFKNNLSDMVKNKKVVEILKRQNFTHYEPAENSTLEKKVSQFMAQQKFKSSSGNDKDGMYKRTLKKMSKIFKSSVYVLDGNAEDYFTKFWKKDDGFGKRKNFNLSGLENALGFLHATGKGDITR